MLECQNINIFAKGYVANWSKEFFEKKMLC